MNVLKSAHRALLASIALFPLKTSAQEAWADSSFDKPPRISDTACAFEPSNLDSPVKTIITVTGPMQILGKQFIAKDVVIDFRGNAEFLVRGNVTSNLPGTKLLDAIVHLDTLQALTPIIPNLINRCLLAQGKRALNGSNLISKNQYG